MSASRRRKLQFRRQSSFAAYNPTQSNGLKERVTYTCDFYLGELKLSEGHKWPPSKKGPHKPRTPKKTYGRKKAMTPKQREDAITWQSLFDLPPELDFEPAQSRARVIRGSGVVRTGNPFRGRRSRRSIMKYYDRLKKRMSDPSKIKRALKRYKRAIKLSDPKKRAAAVSAALRKYKRMVQYVMGTHANPMTDNGGDFRVSRVWCKTTSPDFDLRKDLNQYQRIEFKGKQYAFARELIPTDADFVAPSSTASLDAYGTKLMARAIPTNPQANLGQFLGELIKDGIPTLPLLNSLKEKAAAFLDLSRRGSSEYLNFTFGWRPFLKDLQELAEVIPRANQRLTQFNQNSGKLIRRRRSFPDEVVTTTTNLGSSFGAIAASSCFPTAGVLTKVTQRRTKRWFSGAFTYYLPDASTPLGKARRFDAQANALLGMQLSPVLVWKLAPWSWMLDWWMNIGDVISNFSSFTHNDLVMQYGYVMEHIQHASEFTLVGLTDCYGNKHTISQTYLFETKSRRRATPYGFGQNPANFSAGQWATIAALGITHVPRSLTH